MSAKTIVGAAWILMMVAPAAPSFAAAPAAPTEDEWLNAMSKPQSIVPDLSRAIAALEKKDAAGARESLATCAEMLRRMYWPPAGRIAEEIGATGVLALEARTPFPKIQIDDSGKGVVHSHGTVTVDPKNGDTPVEPMDFVGLETLIEPLRQKIDPEIVARVEAAEIKHDTGDRTGAIADLRVAHARIVADLALAEIDRAHARVVAARAELDAGNFSTALRLLRGGIGELEELFLAAPLAAVRWQLRDAAICAEAQSWDCAGIQIAKAGERIDGLLGTRALKKAEAARLREIATQLEGMEKRLDAGKPASPRELRKIATRAAG
jgi:hypothetical protein